MTKKEIAAQVALRTGITQKRASAIIDQLCDAIKEGLARGEKIELRGFGVFKIRYAKEKIARNLATNTRVVIPPTRRAKFIAGKQMKDLLRRYTPDRLTARPE